MTHRERHTTDEASARDAIRTPPADRSASASPSSPPDASLWAEWFQRASAVQQREALLLAAQQGILYAHQLTAPVHSAASARSLLAGLLNGQVKELEPLHPPALQCHDGELDRTQREAAARAVATPDVCLIQGLPGTGKSRLVAEIIVQAAQRGERVLFLAPTAAALDSVLERLDKQPAVCPLRCLAAEERAASLPPAIARLTLPERLRWYRETTLPAARAVRDAARQTLNARASEQSQWPRLEELAGQAERLAERLRILSERRAGIAAEVERLEQVSASYRERWQACQRAATEPLEHLDSQLAGLQAELETITGKQIHLDSEWQTIRPLVEARQGRRFWTGSWWRAMRHGGLNEQLRDLQARRSELTAARQRLEQGIAARRNERAEIENRYTAERRRLQEEEIARRQTELDSEIAAVAREQHALHEQWRTICPTLPSEAVPAEMSRQAVAAGRTAWEHLRERNAQQAVSAEQWLQTIEEGVRSLPEKLVGCANAIAATTAALAGDEHFGDRNGTPAVLFDLLILEEAHRLTEAEFAAAARRARRWVLIGEPQSLGEAEGEPAASAAGWGASTRQLTLPVRLPPFEHLWRNLHADPHRLPFAWMRREGRLLCRLRLFSAEQAKWIETEPVIDRPDIELRILSVPRLTPQVVEVLFPAGMDIGEAKQFLLHELEELAIQTRGRSTSWAETADAVILELAVCVDVETVMISLEGGVRERLARLPAKDDPPAIDGIDWHTCSLEFARADGWTRQRARSGSPRVWDSVRSGARLS